MKKTIAVIMSCHNRVNTTLECLKDLYSQILSDEIKIVTYLVDDGSTDGTGKVISEKYPEVIVLKGDGSLFWNRGMYMAFAEAIKKGADYYLWLNDDTNLYENGLNVLLDTHKSVSESCAKPCIVIGSTADPVTTEFTYGGYVKAKQFNPLSLKLNEPGEQPIKCETFCGNCVLIPKNVVERVGNMNYIYSHRWGDVDYGLRANKQGCESWVAPGYIATCEDNPNADVWQKQGLTLREKFKELHSIKGIGKKDWFLFVKLHGGIIWPLIWIRPYIRIILSSLFNKYNN